MTDSLPSKRRLPESLLKISKAQHLRDLANENRISAGILNECATLFEDADLLLGRLAECFDEQESEFADISEMRGRIRGDLIAPARGADEPSAAYIAPIAKLTVRDGLVQRAGLYAPGLPDGDHDVYPVGVAVPPPAAQLFQDRVRPWLWECFGREVAENRIERNHRFLEESLELVQACGCTREHALQIVEYVYGRPAGETFQEVGGVMVTLAALCLAQMVSMDVAAETELARVWQKINVIRAKQARKVKDSALPGASVTK